MKHSAEIWDQFLEKNYNRLRQFVFRSFPGNPGRAEEVFSCVLEKLMEDNRKRLTKFEGRNGASEKTYLFFICKRLIAECGRKRCKIPQWLLNLGNMLMIKVYDLMCCKKMSEGETSEYLTDGLSGSRNPKIIQEAIDSVHDKYPKCMNSGDREDELDENETVSESLKNPDEELENKESGIIYRFILDIAGEEKNDDWDWTGIADIRNRIQKHFKPSNDKLVFLKMIYQDGMNITQAGKIIGWNKNQSHGQHRRLLEQLRDIIGTEELRRMIYG
ncbi:MAG: hypothetical protein V2I97_07465 [Desulfococcaceae bacterium]|jgi:DNA-directed RNA polymerase specialized sigma24 family protein|nr:hypothetical protein [Desulfococcaceae bacterium]